jgi:hypothetical protein
MAAKKKPQIGFGPISDDVANIIKKAIMKGGDKGSQGRRVLRALESRAGGMFSSSPAAKKVTQTNAAARKGRKQVERTIAKRADMAKTTKMAKEFGNSQSGKGLKWDGSPTKGTKAYKAGQSKAERDMAAKKTKETAINKNTRYMNKIDVEKARGTGRTVSPTSGKVRIVPKGRAAEGRSRAGAMESSLGKRFADGAAKRARLEKAVKDAKTPEARLKARRALRDFPK